MGNFLGQSVSNAEFASRARDLERKGVSTFDVGSTMDVLLEGDAGFEVEELQRYGDKAREAGERELEATFLLLFVD